MALQARGTPTDADLPMPGTFTPDRPTIPDQSYRDTSQAPPELSLVLYRPASPVSPMEFGEETERQFSPTATLETENVDYRTENGSSTPRRGYAEIPRSPSQVSSQSPLPSRLDKGKGRMEPPYPDDESMVDPVEGEDINMSDLDTNTTPFSQRGQVFPFPCASVIGTLTLSRVGL